MNKCPLSWENGSYDANIPQAEKGTCSVAIVRGKKHAKKKDTDKARIRANTGSGGAGTAPGR